MTTAFKYRIRMITTDKNLGDSLVRAFSPFYQNGGDVGAVTEAGVRLTPSAWAFQTMADQTMVGVIDALNEGAAASDPRLSFMNPGRINAATWENAKLNIVADWWQFWVGDGAMTGNMKSLDEFIALHGYTRVDP